MMTTDDNLIAVGHSPHMPVSALPETDDDDDDDDDDDEHLRFLLRLFSPRLLIFVSHQQLFDNRSPQNTIQSD